MKKHIHHAGSGKVQAVVGLEYRDSRINDVPSDDSIRGNLFGFTTSAITKGGADQGLEAETAKTLNVGIVLNPSLPDSFGEFAFAVDYFRIRIKDEVTRIGSGALLRLCYDDPQFRSGGRFCRNIEPRAAGSNALTVNDSFVNIANQRASGFDYNLRYSTDIGPGTFRFNAEVTQNTESKERLFADDPFENLKGIINNPEFVGDFDFTYRVEGWTFRYGLSWIDGMDSYEISEEDPATSDFDLAVSDYFLHSLSVQYAADDWAVTFGIRNLLDKEPPTISFGIERRVGNAPLYSGYDYIGRQAFLRFSKQF
jgi:iron complex outermembrane recepter protein